MARCGGKALLLVHPSVPANSVKELIALAKAKARRLAKLVTAAKIRLDDAR